MIYKHALGRRGCEILLPLSFRWQPNIANNAKLNVVTRRWREHFPTPPSPFPPPALQPPIALPIFSRSSAVGSGSIELTD
jgi:hypothetical protein